MESEKHSTLEIVSGYQFAALENLALWRERIEAFATERELKGTVLLQPHAPPEPPEPVKRGGETSPEAATRSDHASSLSTGSTPFNIKNIGWGVG